MRLYILRHGKAEADSESGFDVDRALSLEGVKQSRWLADAFTSMHPPAALAVRPQGVLSSPATRAASTASIIAEALGLAVVFEEALSLHASLEQSLDLVATLRTTSSAALIVGHNPVLPSLIERLGGEPILRTGELVAFEVATGGGQLVARELGRFRAD
jgi:phosphohistidine phosphatase